MSALDIIVYLAALLPKVLLTVGQKEKDKRDGLTWTFKGKLGNAGAYCDSLHSCPAP